MPSPLKFPSFDDPSDGTTDNPSKLQTIERLDQVFVPLSAVSRGVRRLRIPEVLRLASKDECVLFIPPVKKNSPPQWIAAQDKVMSQMKRIVIEPYRWTLDARQRDEAWEKHLQTRKVPRDGAYGFEFHLSVRSYAERQLLATINLPVSEVDHLLAPTTGAGITFDLLGYGHLHSCHIKFNSMPFLEFYVPVKADDCAVGNLKFTRSTKEEVLCNELTKQFHEARGDPYGFANIIIAYHRQVNSNQSAQHKNLLRDKQLSDSEQAKAIITQEVNDDAIDNFANLVDAHIKQRFIDTIAFHEIHNYLIKDKDMVGFYNIFKEQFPTIHHALHEIVSSKRFNECKEIGSDRTELLQKQRMIFMLFLSAIRAKSCYKLKHYAIIDPLANFYHGQRQPRSKSHAGAFNSSLPTALATIDELYEENYPAFASRLEQEDLVVFFDNYQKVIPKKNQSAFKSSITHKGTSFGCKEMKNIEIPPGSCILSECGLKVKVLSSSRHVSNMRFMLGSDGDDAMHDAHAVHTKEKTRERKKEELILVANRHFECKMEKRMNKLMEKKSQSELNTYTRRKLSWRNRYRIRMQELRVDVPRDGGNRK